MKLEIVKRRTLYASETFLETWTLCFRKFFPLLGAWFVSLALPVTVLCAGIFFALAADWKVGLSHGGYWTLAILLAVGFVISWLWLGWTNICIKIARGMDLKMSDILSPAPKTLSGFVVLAVTVPLIALGMPLVIVGPLLFLRWQLAPYYIVDRGYGPLKALKQSWRDTELMLMPLAMLDLMFVGVASVLGLSVIVPLLSHMVFSVASAIVYTKWLTDDNNPEIIKLKMETGEHHDSRAEGN